MSDTGRRFSYAIDRAHGRPAKRPKTLRCAWCRAKFDVKPYGPLPKYCCQSHRQRAFERRARRKPHLMALDRDLAQVKKQGYVTWPELRALLGKMGMAVPPSETPQQKRPALRVVEPDAGPGDEAGQKD